MASAANLVLANFYWRVESLSPTDTTTSKKFLRYDPHLLDADVSSGLMRAFTVTWGNSSEIIDPSDITERTAEHEFTLEIVYPIEKFKHYELQCIVLKDRHDLIKKLRDPDYYNGVSSTATTTTTGLWARAIISDTLKQDSPTTWVLSQKWRCTINEGE
jgi:hypothetical protein